jgi:hypothetical protein
LNAAVPVVCGRLQRLLKPMAVHLESQHCLGAHVVEHLKDMPDVKGLDAPGQVMIVPEDRLGRGLA